MRRDLIAASCHPHITSAATVHLGDAPFCGSDTCPTTRIIPHQRGFSADANPLDTQTRERSGLTIIDALRSEREWSIIRGIMGRRVAHYSEVAKSDLITIARAILPHGHDDTRASYILESGIRCVEWEIRDLLRRAEEPDSVLAYPWPGPDQEARSSTRWSHRFSDELKQALIRDIYTSAIVAYQHTIDTFFPRFKPTLKRRFAF